MVEHRGNGICRQLGHGPRRHTDGARVRGWAARDSARRHARGGGDRCGICRVGAEVFTRVYAVTDLDTATAPPSATPAFCGIGTDTARTRKRTLACCLWFCWFFCPKASDR